MEMRRTHCLYHEAEVITNFCRDKQCLMPLCPTCIREHTFYHQELHTKPQYYNIHQTVLEVRDSLSSSITKLGQIKKRTSHLNIQIQAWKGQLAQQIQATKESLHLLIEEQFVRIELHVQAQFAQFHQERRLFSSKQTLNLENRVEATLKGLSELYNSLKTDRYLGSIIIYLQTKHNQIQALHSKASAYLQANEKYNPILQVTSGFQKQFVSTLHKVFRIEFASEKPSSEHNSHQNSISPIHLRRKLLDEKLEKIQRSYTPEKSATYLPSGGESSRVARNSLYQRACGRQSSQFSFQAETELRPHRQTANS